MSSVLKYPKPGQKIQLPDSIVSLDSAILAKYIQTSKMLVILCSDVQSAHRLKTELSFFSPGANILLLPDWETLPYDHFSPHADLISERLATLWQIHQRQAQVIIIPMSTAVMRLLPKEYLLARSFFLKTGQKLYIDALVQNLIIAGYSHVDQVVAPGEFAIRGGIIDLFPMGTVLPYRIDLFDNEIDTLRTFDPDTQRTVHPVNEIRLLPAREYPTDKDAIATFRHHYREKINGDPSRSHIYRDVSAGIWPAGIEYYLPLFYEQTETIFDYIDDSALWVIHNDIQTSANKLWQDISSRYTMLKGDPDRPVLSPQQLYLMPDELMAALKKSPRLILNNTGQPSANTLPLLSVDRKAEHPLHKLDDFCRTFKGRILIAAETLGRREVMQQFLREHHLQPQAVENWADFCQGKQKLSIGAAPLYNGFIYSQTPQLAIITETELYQHVARNRNTRHRLRPNQTVNMLRDLAEIKIGDLIVHEDHGIGRYQGLITMDLGEGETELMQLEYSEGAKLYVPVAQLHLISRYSGQSGDQITLHRLGNPQWEKAKRKAAEQAQDTAAELLNLYAQRCAREGYSFNLSPSDYELFCADFEFEETPDQAHAINAVIEDMSSGRAMDRLICGDVGFGKTEVALRAAFIAAMAGKQVAVLVPTTLLAGQHFQTFSDRFADWPVKIAELSRFRTGKETSEALKELAEGKVDIVIGTHKLIQPDIQFSNLGLIIIDEEHRFGVRQKEKLKQLRASVDVLALTATPIPRTLSMAIEGLRDFSVIATAPNRRLSVKTFVSPYRTGIAREAILRELKRGGQVFFLHNEVSTIANMQERLQEAVPEARIGIAHGQMHERELEQVMRSFLQQRYNVLLCTTIIETGIDIPNANTILINRADKFGLAQLHQLRGRVGRSHHQAYAYLLTPDDLSGEAKKRLEAIQMSDELGSGFFLAMQDLEIRGAGEILGDDQSGEIQTIGFSLYSDMLKQAVRALKRGETPDINAPLGITTEIKLHSPALLPETYCPDVHERLLIYKRLAACEDSSDIHAIQEELIDRFGLMPPSAKTLLDSHQLRLLAKPLGIKKLDASDTAILIQFVPNPPVDPAKIIMLIQSNRHYKLAGPDRLKIEVQLNDIAMRIVRIKELLKSLQS